MAKRKLNIRQRQFCDEYLVDFNATQAYIRAGYLTNKYANNHAWRLLQNEGVIELINEKRKELEKKIHIKQADILKELGNIAFSDVTDFVSITEKELDNNEENRETKTVISVKNTQEIPKEKRNAISFIKQGSNGVEIKFNDKLKALELLGKHLGLFDKNGKSLEKLDDNGLISAIKEASTEAWEDEIPKIQ